MHDYSLKRGNCLEPPSLRWHDPQWNCNQVLD